MIVVANLGHLKIYRVLETPTRGRKLELIEEMEFPEAHGHFLDKVTDMAGRFRISTGVGTGTAVARGEALTAELEIQRRLVKLVAEKIESALLTERPERWHFAAAPEIHAAILGELDPDLSRRIVRSVHADLTKVPPSEVLSHFLPAKAA